MKISIPSEDKTMDSAFCRQFGAAPYYVIYDTADKKQVSAISNGAINAENVAVRAAKELSEAGVDAVVVDHISTVAFDALEDMRIEPFEVKCVETVADAVDKFLNAQIVGASPFKSECKCSKSG